MPFPSPTTPLLLLTALTSLLLPPTNAIGPLPFPPVPPLNTKPPLFHPVMPDNFPDPALITVNNTLYAFATASLGVNTPIASNDGGKGWQILHDPTSNKPLDALRSLPAWSSGNIWAPDVIQTPNGKYILYFSATPNTNSKLHCIGAATAPSLLGPYDPLPNSLACPVTQGGAIDPSPFTDTDGTPYVVYKIDGNSLSGPNNGPCGNEDGKHPTPLMIQKLASDYTTPVGDPVQLLDKGNGDGPLIEAPSLAYFAAGGQDGKGVYVLSFSSNCYNGPWYDSSYATSTQGVLGPYKKTGTPLLRPGEHGLQSPGGLSFDRGAGGEGDGKGGVVVFHADETYSDASVRQLYVQHVQVGAGVASIV